MSRPHERTMAEVTMSMLYEKTKWPSMGEIEWGKEALRVMMGAIVLCGAGAALLGLVALYQSAGIKGPILALLGLVVSSWIGRQILKD